MSTVQGASIYTARKEFEIQAVTQMRLRQFKSEYFRFPRVLCADVFSGGGSNPIGDEIVDGSPIRLLNGYFKAANTKRRFGFWFSDVRPSACTMLREVIRARFGDCLNVKIQPALASDAINVLGQALHLDPVLFLVLFLDPNGPKDFPKHEVMDLLSLFSKRVYVVPYISATTINRCIGARNKAGMQFLGWLSQIENFDDGFVSCLASNGREGWIRKPIEGDRQRWTMLPTFGCMKPRNDWKKQGFVDLKSEDGRNVVKYYCGGMHNGD